MRVVDDQSTVIDGIVTADDLHIARASESSFTADRVVIGAAFCLEIVHAVHG